MHDQQGLGSQDERQIFQRMTSYFDGPAFIRRIKRVEEAYRVLLEFLQNRRAENLEMARLRVGQLVALAGDIEALRLLLVSESDLRLVRELHQELQPKLRLPLEPTRSERTLRGAIGELNESIEAFNRRWRKLIEELDLTFLNNLREGYNRHYLLEKECALGSSPVARLGFQRLEPLTPAHLFEKFPLLEVLQVRE